MQNFVFFWYQNLILKSVMTGFGLIAKVFTKYFHIVHIVSCMPSRELYDLQKSACWEPLAQLFYPIQPKYRFRLQKGVKNEDEKHFKIFNINQWVLRAHFCLIIPCNQSQVVVCSSIGRQIIFLKHFLNMRGFH